MYYNRTLPLVYDLNIWDNYQWKSFLSHSSKTKGIIETGEALINEFGTFAAEVFHRLHNVNPKKLSRIRPEARWAVVCHQQLDTLPDWQKIVGGCEGDRFLAGVTATSFLEHLIKVLPSAPPSIDIQQMRDEVAGLRELKQALLDQNQDDAADRVQKMIDRAIASGKAAVAAAALYASMLEDIGGDLRDCCSAALTEFTEKQDIVTSFGYGDRSEEGISSSSLKEKMQLGQRISKSRKLKEISLQAGRLKRLRDDSGLAKRPSMTKVKSTLVGIETGNNLHRVLPSEFSSLVDDDSFSLFAQKFAEAQLLQYRLEEFKPMGCGPLIVCLDSSGSMDGDAEIWAKAVALNISMIANKSKREFVIIHFDGVIKRIDEFGIEMDANYKSKLLASMQAFYGGGTNWEPPLMRAVELIRNSTTWEKADIIFITDGESQVSPLFLESFRVAKEELKFSVYGILVETEAPAVMARFCDSITTISDLANDSQVVQVFNSI